MPGQGVGVDPVDITAGRLHLRAWQAGDQAVLLVAGRDPTITRWTEVPDPYLAADAEQYVLELAPQGWACGRSLAWAVCDSTTGEVLADVALRTAAGPGVWDVGYWCLPAARGQGVVPEALGAVCRWGFAQLGAVRIEWRAQVGNWSSRRAAEKAGFRVEGVVRSGLSHRGAAVDGWLGALLPGDEVVDTARIPVCPGRTDGVVALRPWRSSDGPDVARACSDPETARWPPVP